MCESMVERVARAIFETWAKDQGVTETWDEIVRLGHSFVDLALKEARAAVEAMREPTDAMVDAGWLLGDTPAKNFVAMIDAALYEQVAG